MLSIGLGFVEQVAEVAIRAGSEIMRVYSTDFAVETKADQTPVTAADKAAEEFILRVIREGLTDKYPIVSEERFADGHIPDITGTPFWLVDPLDGTKEFVSRNGEFTVNIALIEHGAPVLGAVHAPAIGETYWASAGGAFARIGDAAAINISCRQPPAKGLTAYVSRSHFTPEVDTFLADYAIADKKSAGSSLKFCRIAAGQADIYPRLGRTMEWDTASGHAVLAFSGGVVNNIDGGPLTYGKPGFENPHFVAAGPGVLPETA